MSNFKGHVLIIEDQEAWQEIYEDLLNDLGLIVTTADNYDEAINLIDEHKFHLALIDLRLKDDDPNNTQGMDILSHIHEKGLSEELPTMIITGYGTKYSARESFKKYGVLDFIPKFGPEGTGFDEGDFIRNIKSVFLRKYNISL